VVEEELGEQAEVLAEHALILRVNLEDRHVVGRRLLTVDLVAGRVELRDLRLEVAVELVTAGEEVEVELGDVKHVRPVVLLPERREVPRLHLPLPHDDLVDVLDLRRLLVLLERREVELALLLVLLVVELPLGRPRQFPLLALRPEVEPVQRDPLVEAPIEAVVMHIVLPLPRVLVLLALNDLAGLDTLVTPLAHQLGPELEGFRRLRILRGTHHGGGPRSNPPTTL
jgi:hypothetical protein